MQDEARRLAERLENVLGPHEQSVWHGTPCPERYARLGWPMPRAFVGSGLLVAGVVNVGWAAWQGVNGQVAVPATTFAIGMLFSVGLILAGVVLVSSRVWVPYRSLFIDYVLTTERALMVDRFPLRPPWQPAIHVVTLAELAAVPDSIRDVGGEDLFFGLSDEDEQQATAEVERLIAAFPESHS